MKKSSRSFRALTSEIKQAMKQRGDLRKHIAELRIELKKEIDIGDQELIEHLEKELEKLFIEYEKVGKELRPATVKRLKYEQVEWDDGTIKTIPKEVFDSIRSNDYKKPWPGYLRELTREAHEDVKTGIYPNRTAAFEEYIKIWTYKGKSITVKQLIHTDDWAKNTNKY